ncbi:Formation of crista junctions protein 1 [Tulasnella sp. 330]|nr:Formation of crista junctions protein 1 [Tulasnella sp. 330]KAG8886410.1 Formation of crista junctions protein 1 [Tulasnella sp. 331]KAG8886840.1 Formation of crista junctions protein 1 [Tulasnella sp. 332]
MLTRGSAVSRHVATASSSGKQTVKAARLRQVRRLATEADATKAAGDASLQAPTYPPVTPKRRRFLPRLVLYSSAAGLVFYGGSTVVALNNDRYHDAFVESVPFGEPIIDYAEREGWDRFFRTGAPKQVVDATMQTYEQLEGTVSRTLGAMAPNTTPNVPKETRHGQAGPPGSKIAVAAKEGKEQARDVAQTTVRKVKENTDKLPHTAKEVKEEVKNAGLAFSDGVKELVDEVEAVLSSKAFEKAKAPGELVLPDAQPSRGVKYHDPPAAYVPPGMKVWDGEPLPLGHQLPPGYILAPIPKTDATAKRDPKTGAVPPTLPLIAPSVTKLASSEPVIAQLADSIDHLAGFLNDNPTAVTGAKDILQTAQIDLTQLGERLEKVKEEERHKLEVKLDEQAREYNGKLLELEAEVTDKLDRQEEDWKSLFDEERTKVRDQYRHKLQHELETQQELINQRLKEEVIAQGIELQRRWIRDIKLRVETERGGRLAKLDDLATNVKRLERVTLDNSSYIDENISLHSLWSALRAVTNAVDGPSRKAFREELRVLKTVTASRDDPLIKSALDTIEASNIPDTGVEPLSDLTSWYVSNVAPKVENVALVPDVGAGLLSHLASRVLSTFRFKPQGLVEGDDVLSVLARAEFYMNAKDLDSATRELNQLNGWPKMLLQDWLTAARARLEVQQALDVSRPRIDT